MHRQSITSQTLENLIRRSDYRGISSVDRPAHAESLVASALISHLSPTSPYLLKKWNIKGKPHFSAGTKSSELLLRKTAENLRYALPRSRPGRGDIVECLKHLLAEGVPYRVYRLDISGFYESFDLDDVILMVKNCNEYAPCTKALCEKILGDQKIFGEKGIPRGLSASAVISELMMHSFDTIVMINKDVFFYARYVDDILIITGAQEDSLTFRSFLQEQLPKGLVFNEKKSVVKELPKSTKDVGLTAQLQLEYLGYEFTVYDPVKEGAMRRVQCSMADKKVQKIKKRIVRALLDYKRKPDDWLLVDRIKFLTSNFRVFNDSSGKINMAGIHYNYPLIDEGDGKIKNLDKFLIDRIFTSKMRNGVILSNSIRRQLLRMSFEKGHSKPVFTHFSGNRLALIGKCWKF